MLNNINQPVMQDAHVNRHDCGVTTHTAVYLRAWIGKDLHTPGSQELEVRQFCSARGWTNIEIYMDKATGGKKRRPALEKLMKNLRSGKIARVVCHTIQAVGRSLQHLCQLVDEMRQLQVPLLCVGQNIDTSPESPWATFQMHVLAAVCQFQSSLYREKVNSGLASAKAKGVVLGRPATLNERRDEVLDLRRQGCGIREISRQLKMPVSSVAKLAKLEKSL